MSLRHYLDIIAFRREDGSTVAFHGRNLEVAQVDPQVWEALHEADGANLSQDRNEIWAELNSWEASQSVEVRDAEPTGMRSLNLHIAQICNMACSYCAAGGDGTYGSTQARMDVETVVPHLRRMLESVPRGETFQINFFGGEPLIYPKEIAAVIRYAQLLVAGRGIELSYRITTNGTLINEETLRLLTLNHFHVIVSLDGPADINDAVRPMRNGTGSSQRVYKGLELLFGVQSHLKSLQINSVFGSHNLDVISSYEFLSKYPVDKMYFSFSVEDNNEEAALEFVRQMSLVASRAFEKGGEVELRRIDTFDHLFLQLDSQIRIHNHCGAGKSFLVLDTDDNVHACNWLANESSERVGAKGQIDEHALGRYSTSLIELNHCHSCWARYLCGGGCMYVNKMKTGDKHQSDPSFCQKQKGLIQIGIDFYEKARRTEIG